MTKLTFVAEVVSSPRHVRQATEKQIRSFAELPDGWHYGSGSAATEAAIATALEVNSLMAEYGAHEIEVFPDVDGGILVSGYRDKNTLEIFCRPLGKIDLLHEVDDDPAHEQAGLCPGDIGAYLGALAWIPNSSFACYIPCISASEKGDSRAQHSKSLLRTEAFRFSTDNVPLNIVEASASISLGTIKASPDTRPYFGDSIQVFYQGSTPSHASRQSAATPVTGISVDWQTARAAA